MDIDRKRWAVVGVVLLVCYSLMGYFWYFFNDSNDSDVVFASPQPVDSQTAQEDQEFHEEPLAKPQVSNGEWTFKRAECDAELSKEYFSTALGSKFLATYSRDDDESDKAEVPLYPPRNMCPEFDKSPPIITDCSEYGLLPRNESRVFDVTLFGYDVDTLELRWRTLAHVVEKFIVIEAQRTYTNRSRFPSNDTLGTLGRLFLEGGRFRDLKDKVVHHVLLPGHWPKEFDTLRPDQSVEGNALEFETWIRNEYLNHTLLAKAGIKEGDLLMSSDCDELPRPGIVHLLKSCSAPRPNSKQPVSIDYQCIETPIFQWSYLQAEDTVTFASLLTYSPSLNVSGMNFRTRTQPDGYSAPISCIRWGGWSCSGCGLASPLELMRKAYWQSHPYGPEMTSSDRAIFDNLQLSSDSLNYTARLQGWKTELGSMPTTLQQYIRHAIRKLALGLEVFEGGDVYRITNTSSLDLSWWLESVLLNQTSGYSPFSFAHFVDRAFWADSLSVNRSVD